MTFRLREAGPYIVEAGSLIVLVRVVPTGVFPNSLLTAQQGPDERQESWALTDVLQSFNTDADIIQSHQHQPAAKHELTVCFTKTLLCTADVQH